MFYRAVLTAFTAFTNFGSGVGKEASDVYVKSALFADSVFIGFESFEGSKAAF